MLLGPSLTLRNNPLLSPDLSHGLPPDPYSLTFQKLLSKMRVVKVPVDFFGQLDHLLPETLLQTMV